MTAKKTSALPRPPGRPRREKARQDILKSAYRLLKTKGFNAVGAQEIANGAKVSTATLYRWWNTKEEIMFDACFEHVKPALAFAGDQSPLARLRDQVVRGAEWLGSEDATIMARLIAGIHGDKKLQHMFLERFYLPRRRMQLRIVKEAIACGELRRDTDPELLIDALYGPSYFSWLRGTLLWTRHLPKLSLTRSFRWDENAGLRRDAIRSQVIDALEAQEIKETGNEKD